MSTERNASCPCGSGKKYKKCCLDKHKKTNQYGDQASEDQHDFYWHQQFKMRSALIHKILDYAVKIYGKHALVEAWDEFQGWPEDSI
jgi:hypothetical protein